MNGLFLAVSTIGAGSFSCSWLSSVFSADKNFAP